MGGIYEVCSWDGIRWHDIHTKFHNDWFSHSEVDRGIHRYTAGGLTSLLFFQNEDRRLKIKAGL
jgi:hypothetical protein